MKEPVYGFWGRKNMIYLDNGATSYPKPAQVLRSTVEALKNFSFNSGRGGYRQSVKAAEKIYQVREKVSGMFSCEPQNIVFTKNCTEALNIAIKGSVKKGSHVIISSLEHNAVWRVVSKLKEQGIIDFDIADFDYDDDVCVSNFESLIRENTDFIVCMTASNVFGVAFPVRRLAALAHRYSVRFIADAAQTAGIMPVCIESDGADIICAPGHKCLYAQMGTGFMASAKNIKLDTLIQGGTGSASLSASQPSEPPERFEAGTLNNSGIISLGAGIDFINKRGMENIYGHEMRLARFLYDGINQTPNTRLYVPRPENGKSAPIVAFNMDGKSSESVAASLAAHDIAVRAGYHCSALAHSFFKTLDTGVVRLCPSVFTTQRDCEVFLNTLKKL